MKLKKAIEEAVSAGYGGIWVRSPEHEDAIRLISDVCKEFGWNMAMFDLDRGFRIVGAEESHVTEPSLGAALKASIKWVETADDVETEDSQYLLVVRNLHFSLNNSKTIQILQHVIEEGAALGLHVIGLTPEGIKLPRELDNYFYPTHHTLPDMGELYDLVLEVDDEIKMPEKGSKDAEQLLSNVTGMTRMAAMGAYGISLARHNKMDPETLSQVKSETMEAGGLLSIHESKQGFEAVAGCDHIKDFLKTGILSPNKTDVVRLRAVMLLGWPGTGKSFLTQCLGKETTRPTVEVDVGALKGSLVGQTEENTRRALATLDAMAPCIAYFDEIEKAVTTNAMDSGASSGQLGALLTWLNDHTSDVVCVFTSNDISHLPPEFLRAERMDGIFYFGRPTREAKDRAWEIYEAKFGVSGERPDDTDWTPAEIKTCCRLAALFDRSLVDSANQVVPVYRTNGEKINALEEWAEDRCLSADYHGVFTRKSRPKMIERPGGGEKPRRRVRRKAGTK